LLAGFEVLVDGMPVDLALGAQRVIAFLALANRTIERAAVAFRLWPDKREPRALANLRSALWRIRQQSSILVETTPTHVRLSRDTWVDTWEGLAELRHADVDTLLAAHESVIAIFAGDLLPDWYDEWIVGERDRLRELQLHTIEACCRRLIEDRRYGEAIDLAFRSIAAEPLRESAHRLVVTAHLGEGNVDAARRHFASYRDLVVAELGVEPSPGLRSLVACRDVPVTGVTRQLPHGD
jgi:DNA-binding SARP family transcriptional activator